MAEKTAALWRDWTDEPARQMPAIDAFLGDIYSGLQVQSFTETDRVYANEYLYILSGLYGALRALDGIYPYRLEMAYHLPDEPYRNLYSFWGNDIATSLPTGTDILNLSAAEYTKTLLPQLQNRHVIAPKFLTIQPKSGEPKFVTVHAKIARGAFAHWVITQRIETAKQLIDFNELGYVYNANLSTPSEPVFVCQTFQGLGLSVRLS